MKKHMAFVCLFLLIAVFPGFAQNQKTMKDGAKMEMKSSHIIIPANDIKWVDAPNLGGGVQLAVLEGDPSKDGLPFSLRVKFPAGFKVPPHWHPVDEHVVVLQGTFLLGMGDKFNENGMQELNAGSFIKMPKLMRHFALAQTETIVQVYGIGPFKLIYVNPADDPTKQTKTK